MDDLTRLSTWFSPGFASVYYKARTLNGDW